jgi:hypothetical protein
MFVSFSERVIINSIVNVKRFCYTFSYLFIDHAKYRNLYKKLDGQSGNPLRFRKFTKEVLLNWFETKEKIKDVYFIATLRSGETVKFSNVIGDSEEHLGSTYWLLNSTIGTRPSKEKSLYVRNDAIDMVETIQKP